MQTHSDIHRKLNSNLKKNVFFYLVAGKEDGKSFVLTSDFTLGLIFIDE